MATIDIPSSPTNTIRPNRRRDTESSGISEDDIAALRSAEIEIDGEAKSTIANAPSFSLTSSDQSSNENSKSTTNKSSGGMGLSSLRSLLGIPGGSQTTPLSSTNGNSGKTSTSHQSSTSSLAPPGGGRPNNTSSSLLGVPPSTTARTAPPGVGGASGASIQTSLGRQTADGEDGRALLKSEIAPKRKKVVLDPGCSALDWARTKQEILSERMKKGPEAIRMKRITKSELKEHNTIDDAWSAFQGKVYDLTPYLKFHPGGKQELMRVAGRDGTRLFMLTHSWVNIDAMIDACCIGVLVSDS